MADESLIIGGDVGRFERYLGRLNEAAARRL
jgi:hypothetical protein